MALVEGEGEMKRERVVGERERGCERSFAAKEGFHERGRWKEETME